MTATELRNQLSARIYSALVKQLPEVPLEDLARTAIEAAAKVEEVFVVLPGRGES